ncbi:MAG TPA: hypothetical protein VGK61_00585 [Planctomycetota bacterium]
MKASEKLTRIMVWAGKHDAVFKKYSVTGSPTLLFLKPDGAKVAVGGRDSAGLIKQFNEIAEKYNRAPKWAESMETATAKAKEESKPLLVVYRDGGAKSDAAVDGFSAQPLAELYDKFVWVQKTLDPKSDEAKALGITAVPALWVVDPRIEDSKGATLKKIALPKAGAALKTELGGLLKSWKKEEPAKEEPKKDGAK